MTPVEQFAAPLETRVQWSRSGFWCDLDDERCDDSRGAICRAFWRHVCSGAAFTAPTPGRRDQENVSAFSGFVVTTGIVAKITGIAVTTGIVAKMTGIAVTTGIVAKMTGIAVTTGIVAKMTGIAVTTGIVAKITGTLVTTGIVAKMTETRSLGQSVDSQR